VKNMKTVIITGGNRGLGYECARTIASEKDWQILIACRSPGDARQAVNDLRSQSGSTHIEAWPLDLASIESINNFASKVKTSNLPPLAALVCNAGVQLVSGTKRTLDGFEMTFGVNHLGHYLLVNRLLETLVPPARIVFVSSDTHDPAQKTGMPEPQYSTPQRLAFPPEIGETDKLRTGQTRYTTSKLANILTTYELARRLEGRGITGITVNAFNPGLMPGTGLAQDYHPVMRFMWKYILPLLTRFRPGVNRVEDSGVALARLVLAPELANITGKYFSGQKMIPSSVESYDRAKAAELWEASARLVGLIEYPDSTSQNHRE
jgi:NAD(P)-dependent dehydrogenase (short-subunit alcohol dehydrogenase family)